MKQAKNKQAVDIPEEIRLGIFIRRREDADTVSGFLREHGYILMAPAVWREPQSAATFVLMLDMKTCECYLQRSDLFIFHGLEPEQKPS